METQTLTNQAVEPVIYRNNEPLNCTFAAIERYIQTNYHKTLNLAHLSKASGLSLWHFARRFKKATGLSPKQYILKCRVQAAWQLLQQGDLSVCEVATQTGFSDQSHLVKYFKKHLGLTPREVLDKTSNN